MICSTLQNLFVFDWISGEDADISTWVVSKGGVPAERRQVWMFTLALLLGLSKQKELFLNEALATNQHCKCLGGKGRGAVERGVGFNSSCGSAT